MQVYLEQQEKLQLGDREDIRLVTELLFARSFSPEAFEGYLGEDRNGQYEILRLPAKNDPMLERVASIRERDQMFIDTLQEYYRSFGIEMNGPYQEWRKESFEEAVALQQLQSESTRQMIAGGMATCSRVAWKNAMKPKSTCRRWRSWACPWKQKLHHRSSSWRTVL